MTKFLLLICVYWLASQATSQDTLKPGDKLNSSSQLVSAKGIFTLGFYTVDQTNNSYIAIHYRSDPHNPVWIGNRKTPVSKNADPVLSMDSTGKLIIMHGRRKSIEVYAGGLGKNVTATLLDTGNFIVKDMSSNGEVLLWESFDHPTDTLLPGMKLGVNHRTGRNWTLNSWFRDDNPAPGAFTLEWDPIPGRLLIKRRGMVYWTSGEMKDYYVQPGNLRVKEFENFNFQPDLSNFNYNFTSHDEEYFMYSLITDPKRMSEQRKVISGWRLNYTGDIFDSWIGGGMTIAMASSCYGYNNEGSDKGCELRKQPQCRKHHETFVLRAGYFNLVNGESPFIYDENSSLSLSDCRDHCWKNCKCVAYTQQGKGCVYWNGKNLKFEQSLDGSNANLIYVLDRPPSGKKKYVVMILVISVVAVFVFVIGLFIVWKMKRGKREKELQELLTLEGYTENYKLENAVAQNHDLRLFTYASIQSATNNFSSEHKLGQGGFGPVYKGRTPEGWDIAVKLLSQQSGQGLLEFKTELILISKLQHVNLVKLLGFCIHGNDKMIIYNYMPNKSLDVFLFNPSKRELLDWPQRFNVIQGIAQGLLYLHKYSRLKIVHRDLKPSNILLDENMKPKISDFGLARIFKHNIEEVNTNRRVGTYGYMAPEYAMEGIFSFKSDVYSFGVLVLEIVSGRKNNSFHEVEGPLNLVEHAWELWKTESAVELMDPSLGVTCVAEQLQRCIHVGLVCVENCAADRPTIEDVLSMLKSETNANFPEPRNPGFITRRSNVVVGEVERVTEEKISSLSANKLTISQVGGR